VSPRRKGAPPGRLHVRYGEERRCEEPEHGGTQVNQTIMLPASLDEAVTALAASPAAVPVAGGTDLMGAVNAGLLRPMALIGLGRINELRGWQYQDGAAQLGAGLTHARMGRPDFAALMPALAEAARSAGPPQVRNAGRSAATSSPPTRPGTPCRCWPRWRPRSPWSAPRAPARCRSATCSPGSTRCAAANCSATSGSRCCTPRRSSSRPPAAPAPPGPPPRSRWCWTRPGARCAARSARSPGAAAPAGGRAVGLRLHRLGRRPLHRPRRRRGLRRVRRLRLRPRAARRSGRLRRIGARRRGRGPGAAAARLRRTVSVLARRALGGR